MSGAGRRILLYTETTGRGGAEVSLRNLARSLDPALDVTVMGVDAEICSWIASARPGTPVVLVRPVPNKLSIGRFLALRRHIARVGPDIFHANLRTIGDAGYGLAAALSVRGVKVVAVEQLPLPPTTRLAMWLKRRTSARLAAHVAVGRRVARLVEESARLKPDSVFTIYNGVPDLGPAAGRPAGSATVIGTFARLDRVKGLDVLLEAAAGLPDANVVVAGEGPERDSLRADARRLGLEGRLQLVPWSDAARDLLGDMDVFVLPSRNEGFPLSIVEAMLAARPVVATDVGSVREAVLDGVSGFVVPPDDVDALRSALRRLLDDAELRVHMGEAGRARALDHFTDTAMARAFEQLYERIDGRRT